MDHWEFKEAVHNYRQRSGHAINYYDGGYSATDTGAVTARPVQKGSLAKDKMRDLHGKADGSVNRGTRRRNVDALVNDYQ
jgi:hypothetical protein